MRFKKDEWTNPVTVERVIVDRIEHEIDYYAEDVEALKQEVRGLRKVLCAIAMHLPEHTLRGLAFELGYEIVEDR